MRKKKVYGHLLRNDLNTFRILAIFYGSLHYSCAYFEVVHYIAYQDAVVSQWSQTLKDVAIELFFISSVHLRVANLFEKVLYL